MSQDNAAYRLLAIILEGKKHMHTDKCRDVWTKILSANDESALLIKLGWVADLPRQIIDTLLEADPTRRHTWKHWRSQVADGFAKQELNGPWQNFIGRIDEHSIDALHTVAELLEHISPKSLVEQSELDDLKAKLTELLKETRDSTEIDNKLKKIICKAVLEIINAIDQYFIRGIEGVAEALESAAGSIFIDASARQFVKKDGLGKKFLSVLGLVNKTVDSAEKFVKLGEDAHAALDGFDLLP